MVECNRDNSNSIRVQQHAAAAPVAAGGASWQHGTSPAVLTPQAKTWAIEHAVCLVCSAALSISVYLKCWLALLPHLCCPAFTCWPDLHLYR
jgi:hypothetical protein